MDTIISNLKALFSEELFWQLVVPLALVVLAFFKRSITRENRRQIGIAFRETVEAISSPNIEVRMASAILLRRFFDEKSEFGVGGAPFAKDTVNVIAAILKTLKTSDFQKTLADSLKFAPNRFLKNGDFQRANLAKAYLGEVGVAFEDADFYQANLSGASFKGANLKGAKFYEAKLSGTVFTKTCLASSNFASAICQNVSFRDADLSNANFEGAILRNVDFTGANTSGAKFGNVCGYDIIGCDELRDIQSKQLAQGKGQIFISRPGALDVRQQTLVDSVKDLIRNVGYTSIDLPRDEYDKSKVLANLSERMNDCRAVVVFGFRSLYVEKGEYRSNTEDSRVVKDEYFPTAWSHIEAGMGLMKRVPVLVLRDENVADGVFDENVDDPLLTRCAMEQCLTTKFNNVETWLKAISGEHPQSPPAASITLST